jgi:hypothetical protein
MTKRKNPNPARHHRWHAPDGEVYDLIDGPHDMVYRIPPPSVTACERALACDPNHCALAEMHMEIEGVPVAQFGSDKCYIPLRIDGKIVVYRMKLRKRDRERINEFDKTGIWPDDEGVFLYGIAPYETLDSQRSKDKRLRERWATMKERPRKKMTRVYLRDASRRAQVTVSST